MKCLFLQEDFDCLKKEQEKLLERHKKIGQDLGEACDQSSETYHDNAPFDDAMHNAKLNEERLSEIGDILIKVKIVKEPQSFGKVKIGNIVKTIDEEGNKKDYKIGSYIAGNNAVSYQSPLGDCLLNKRIGSVCKLKVGDREKKLKILEIR